MCDIHLFCRTVRVSLSVMLPYIRLRALHITYAGFRELGRIPLQLFLNTIKVTFINAQGLLEAGIDEKGVFKVVYMY